MTIKRDHYTAKEILENHSKIATGKKFDYSNSWILDAMKELAELCIVKGIRDGWDMESGDSNRTIESYLKQEIDSLFPDREIYQHQ